MVDRRPPGTGYSENDVPAEFHLTSVIKLFYFMWSFGTLEVVKINVLSDGVNYVFLLIPRLFSKCL